VPFYQAVDPERPERALAADLLAGIGETLGCGQRATTQAEVRANLAFCGVAPDSYDWYVAMKTQAPLVTSGFGLGMERFLLWATRTTDIRDWAMFIRDRHGQGAP
jgi:aspartyl/asparaginyl-tRNA synthetase